MKKSFQYLTALALLTMTFALSSCGDDDGGDGGSLDVNEAQASLDNMASDMSDDVVNLVQSDGVEALDALFDLLELNDPFDGRMATMDRTERRLWMKKRAMLFKTIFIPSKAISFNRVKESSFDFEGNVGIYNWNDEIDEFEKSEEPSDIIVINFPEEGSETNNVQLRILNFEEELIIEEEDGFIYEDYYVTDLEADLSVDGVEQVSVELSIEYNEVGDPVSGNGSLFVNPYTFTINFNDTQATTSSLTASITRDNTNIMSADLTVTFKSAEKEDVSTANGFVQYLTIKLQGTIDVSSLDTEEEVDINDFVSLELFDGSSKIGDVVFETEEDEDGYEEEVPYVEYADGSREKLEDILQPVIDEIEDEFDNWEIGG